MKNDAIHKIINAALGSVQPTVFVPKVLSLSGAKLQMGETVYDLTQFDSLYVVSIGKAAIKMAEAVNEILQSKITAGIVLAKVPDASVTLPENFQVLFGSHPVPTEKSVEATRKLFDFLAEATERSLVLFLISGGGSSLLTLPRAGISLAEWQTFSSLLLGSGADITEFNTLRKHLDRAKGGGLALKAAPAACAVLILSDVVNSPLDAIASGPTVPDMSTFSDALHILEKYNLLDKVPASIRRTIEAGCAGKIPETMKPDHPFCGRIQTLLAADNHTAVLAAAVEARKLGFSAQVCSSAVTGEARAVGKQLAESLAEFNAPDPTAPPSVWIYGGETTVTLRGKGYGGRNLETALGAVRMMSKIPGGVFVTLATDGEDGPTDAAGAIVTSDTLRSGLELGFAPESFLENNDAYSYFRKVNGLIKTGSTGTNVNDLMFLFRF